MHTTFVIYKYTAVLQVFKFHKKEEGGERGKLKTKIQRIKQTNKKTPPNIEKQNKQEKQTQLYRSETTEVTESHTVCGMYIDYRGGDAEWGGVTFVFLPVLGARLHTPVRVSVPVHTHPTQAPRPHAHTLARSMAHPHTDTPADTGRRVVGYHQSASSSM